MPGAGKFCFVTRLRNVVSIRYGEKYTPLMIERQITVALLFRDVTQRPTSAAAGMFDVVVLHNCVHELPSVETYPTNVVVLVRSSLTQ